MKAMIILDTFIPPPVLPAQAPINIISTSTAFDRDGYMSKSSVAKPVVEIREDTVKEA